jgi:hypothetical protein
VQVRIDWQNGFAEAKKQRQGRSVDAHAGQFDQPLQRFIGG